MADSQHLHCLLEEGISTWNTWREEHPDIHPDLSGADLREADFRDGNFTGANLQGTDLRGANCSHAFFLRSEH